MKNMNRKYLTGLMVLTGLLSIAETSSAASYMKFCTTWRSQYTDSGVGEDMFTSTGVLNREAEYAYAKVYNVSDSVSVWNGLLDGSGCSPFLRVYSNTQYKFSQGTGVQRNISGQSRRRLFVNPDGANLRGV